MASYGARETTILSLVLVLLLWDNTHAQVDRTLQDRAVGPEVVQAVVDTIRTHCIYSNDRLFLRRLAYVESRDGENANTFRNGYYGGIWQVDKDKFEATRHCQQSSYHQHLCSRIQSVYNITWESVQWHQLIKPLLSGLAVTLYFQVVAETDSTPGFLEEQALFWRNAYRLQADPSVFITAVQEIPDERCDNKPIDLVFVLDTSTSVGYPNFLTVVEFLTNVTSRLNVGPDGAHVALVSYGFVAHEQFGLTKFTTQAALSQALRDSNYYGGGTNTADGLRVAREQIFTVEQGARPEAIKMTVLVTDGESNSYRETTNQAHLLKQKGVELFSIGIGQINRIELEHSASPPVCTHMYVIHDFADISSLVYQMKRSACTAALVPQYLVSKPEISINMTLTQNNISTDSNKVIETATTIRIPQPTNQDISETVVRTEVTCGRVAIYGSYVTDTPGPAVYDFQDFASEGRPSIMVVNSTKTGSPLHISFIGSKSLSTSSLSQCDEPEIQVKLFNGTSDVVKVQCIQNGVTRPCKKEDYLYHPDIKADVCDDVYNVPVNPCTVETLQQGRLYHPHPFDNRMFIKCDLHGNMYVTRCPNNDQYHLETHTCGASRAPLDEDKYPLDPDLVNPCTVSAIRNHHYYFTYSRNRSQYIHCDVWGHAWLVSCSQGLGWDPVRQECVEVEETTTAPAVTHHHHDVITTSSSSIPNPCTQEALNAGKFFFPLPGDSSQFIRCGIDQTPYILSCYPGQVFSTVSSTCVGRDQLPVVG